MKNKRANKGIYKRLHELLSMLIALATHSIKISFMVGSKAAFFSLGQSISPAIGFFGGPLAALAVYAVRISAQTYFSGTTLLISSFLHVPTMCAALYLSSTSKCIRSLVPLLCIALFVTHPVGSQAAWYSAYWLIPIMLSFIPTNSIFLRSVGSTFVAHAVGSVMWLYTHNIDAASWHALSSVVWAERLMIATSMTMLYYAVVSSIAFAQHLMPSLQRYTVYSTAKKAS
ncbi:hypothetical protein H0X48_05650 [Candidatus Dependentiae bacterium]|nr:hypothetical protein [Candidatus Dependentiae bacterium]